MNNTDKKIAIGGIIVIIALAILACVLLADSKKDSFIKIAPEMETVELNDIDTKVGTAASDKGTVSAEPVVTKVSTDMNNKAKNDKVKSGQNDIAGKYVKCNIRGIKNNDSQLKELYGYWDQGREEAVADLIRLERIRSFTFELAGTSDYYYYGQLDEQNRPNGKGLAIYADDTYYFGTFKSGLRDGVGTWLQIFPDSPGTVGKYKNVVEHFYTGEFKNDLPNGKGQENYGYADEISSEEDNIYNVIGSFKNGYYNGDLLIYTIDSNRRLYEWYAVAREGGFNLCEDKISTTGKHPVWIKGNDNNHDTDESDDGYYWMKDADNKGWGIYGLMK